ncbi:TWiK family of potassium channels protein 7-like [Artemia franciscana]|nr:hypothetical protein QYM36_010891 [Artemia franciscana]
MSETKSLTKFQLVKRTLRELRSTWILHKKELETSWKRLKSGVLWTSLLLVINLVYCIFGGLLFASLEGWHEARYKCGAVRIRRQFIDELWVESGVLPEDEWRDLAREKLIEFEDQLHDAFRAGLNSYSGQRTWGFWDAVVYSLTAISTIGYGHIVPVTIIGRWGTVIYSLIGIPLFLVLLSESGQLLTRALKFFWIYILRFSQTASGIAIIQSSIVNNSFQRLLQARDIILAKLSNSKYLAPVAAQLDSELRIKHALEPSTFSIDDRFDLPTVAYLFVLWAYLVFGTLMYWIGEHWSPFESFYFTFVTLTTIGFGDYVPQHPLALLTSLVYLVFGLSLVGLCIASIQSKLSAALERLRDRLSIRFTFEPNGTEMVVIPPRFQEVSTEEDKKKSE